MRAAGVEQHGHEVRLVVHVGDGLVERVHDEQRVVLERLVAVQVGNVVDGAELLEHRLHLGARLKHSA